MLDRRRVELELWVVFDIKPQITGWGNIVKWVENKQEPIPSREKRLPLLSKLKRMAASQLRAHKINKHKNTK